MFKSKKDVRILMLLILFACFAASLFMRPQWYGAAISYIWDVLSCIISGLCLAFIMNIIMVPIEEKLVRPLFKKHPGSSAPRMISITVTSLIVLALIALTVLSIIPAISGAAEMIGAGLEDFADVLPGRVTEFLDKVGITTEEIQEFIRKTNESVSSLSRIAQESISSSLTFAFNLTTGIFAGLVSVIFAAAIALYALASKEKLGSATTKLSNAFLRPKAVVIFADLRHLMYEKFSEFLRGQLIEAVILGGMCLIGMLIFRFPDAGLISLLVALTSIIPILGPWLGAVGGSLIILFISPVKGLLFALFILILNQVEDNAIYPRIVGKSMGVPGILVLCAVIVGMRVAGIVGIIVAVPLSAVIFELVRKYVSIAPVRGEKKAED